MSLKLKNLFFCAGLLFIYNVNAQNTNNSPYSQFGIGDYNPQFFAAQAGMAGMGVSYANGFNVNNINPSLLAKNDRFAAFDVGIAGQSQKLTSEGKSQNSISGTLQYIALAFPVTSHKVDTAFLHWTTGINLTPYSNIYYKVIFNNPFDPGLGQPTSYLKQGSGGLTKFDFNNGFKLGKKWYAGLKISYVFGDVTRQETGVLTRGGVPITIIDRINQHGFLFKFGTAYRKKLKEKLYFNAGATYEIGSSLSATKIRYTQVPISNPVLSDTLTLVNPTGAIKLPSQYQLGFSFENPYHWAIGADFTYLNGTSSDFSYLYSDKSSINGKSFTYENGYAFTVGGEFTPDIFSFSLWRRITYRAGFNYTLTPITIEGIQVADVSGSAGLSLPVGRGNTMMNLGLSIGQRGNANAVQENYFRVNFGITINDQWFKRRKIE